MNYIDRVNHLRTIMERQHIDVCFIWEPDNQYYFTGFRAISYSRPIYTWITMQKTALIIPELEQLHAEENAIVDETYIYYEQFDKQLQEKAPVDVLVDLIAQLPKGDTIGVQ